MAYVKPYKVEESASLIGANSAVFTNGDPVAIVTGFLVKAIDSVGVPVVGFSNQTSTMSATNQTVAKEKVSYTRVEPYDTRFELNTSAAIAQADVGKYYNVNAAATAVDTATWNAAKQATSKFRLEDIVLGNTTKGVFVAVI